MEPRFAFRTFSRNSNHDEELRRVRRALSLATLQHNKREMRVLGERVRLLMFFAHA